MEAEQQTPAATAPPAEAAPQRKNLFQLLMDWPMPRKLAAAAVVLITIVLFAVLIIQARVADHQLLYANLTEADASSVVTWLKGQRIPYTLKNGGRNILVPADQIYEARLDLAANGLPSGGGVGFEVFDNQSFALTDYVQKVNYTRALQGELARTITTLGPVESTRVHLALPEKRLFKNQQKNATASVIVTLGQGRTLDPSQVQGILHLVAGSVTGLETGNVKVIDSNGVVLKAEDSGDNDMLSVDMLTFQQEVESRLELRAQALLDKTMGKNKAMVRVTATLDFAKVEKTEELFDADEPVVRSEQISSVSGGGGQAAGGIPGVQSNLQGNAGGVGGTTASGTSSSSRTTNYEISKTISKIVNPVGTITKLSVSVLVADKVPPGEDTEEQPAPRTQEELDALKEMVGTALGIVPQRGDQITVVSMPFIDPPPAATDQGGMTAQAVYQYIPIIKIALVSLGAILLYLLLIRPIIKTMRTEVTEHYKTVDELEKERMTSVDEKAEDIQTLSPDEKLRHLRRNVITSPTQTSFIVKNWLNEG